MSSLDWGSVPVWVATVVTSTSAVLAVVSYRRSLYDKAREQASKVSCRISQEINEKVIETAPKKFTALFSVLVQVANRSDAPIYDLEVTIPGIGMPLKNVEMPAGAIGTGTILISKRQFDLSSDSGQFEFKFEFDISGIAPPVLTFTDALGRRWRRDRGRLRRAMPRSKASVTTYLNAAEDDADRAGASDST